MYDAPVHGSWSASLLLAIGCGRVSFDPLTSATSDARSDGSGAAGDPDGGDLGDALTSTGPCPPPAVTDAFNDGALAAGWLPVIDPDVALAESGGHLVFTFASPAQSSSTTTFTSPLLDVRDRCVTLDIANIRGVTNSTTGFEVGTVGARMRISVVGTVLGGVDQPATTFPPTFGYDPVLDARWQIRIGGGRVVAITLDTADNPHRLLMDLPSFFDETAARITLYSGVTSGTVSGGTAELDAIAY